MEGKEMPSTPKYLYIAALIVAILTIVMSVNTGIHTADFNEQVRDEIESSSGYSSDKEKAEVLNLRTYTDVFQIVTTGIIAVSILVGVAKMLVYVNEIKTTAARNRDEQETA
jgi:cell division protein FtsX